MITEVEIMNTLADNLLVYGEDMGTSVVSCLLATALTPVVWGKMSFDAFKHKVNQKKNN